ncbi:hypothetical protein AB1L42_01525 [Thalassoglobus sp. JC818]|uniref:hypothetical protein n=1 Tax=Thalassoglobus sp. JC818 TaxID=3232136 RepID=UPI0034587364
MAFQSLSSQNDPLRNNDFFHENEQQRMSMDSQDSIGSIDSELGTQINQVNQEQEGKFHLRWYRPGAHDLDAIFAGSIAAARRGRKGVNGFHQEESPNPSNSTTASSSQFTSPLTLSPRPNHSEAIEESHEMTVRLVNPSSENEDEISSPEHLGQPSFSFESLRDLTLQLPDPDISHSMDSTLDSQDFGTETTRGTSKIRLFGWRRNTHGEVRQVEMVPLVCQDSVQVPDNESLVGHEVTVLHRGEKWFKRGLVAGLAANAGLALGSGIVAAITAKGTVLTIASILGIASGPVGWVIGSIALTVIVSSCLAGAAVSAPILIHDVKQSKKDRKQFEEAERERYIRELNAVGPPKRGAKVPINFDLDEYYFESDELLRKVLDEDEVSNTENADRGELETDVSLTDLESSSSTGTSREKSSDTGD